MHDQTHYIIRPATLDDVDGLIAMHAQSWIDTYPDEAQGVSREYIEDRVKSFSAEEGRAWRAKAVQRSNSDSNYFMRVATDADGTVVGFVQATRGEEAELNALYVDKSAHGTGIAQRLMDPALKWLGTEIDITLSAAAYNDRALGFYRKYGFEIVPGSEHFFKESPIRTVKMIKKETKHEV